MWGYLQCLRGVACVDAIACVVHERYPCEVAGASCDYCPCRIVDVEAVACAVHVRYPCEVADVGCDECSCGIACVAVGYPWGDSLC